MSTYTQIIYHIVFSTKRRVPDLIQDKRPEIYRYIWGILKNKECHLYRIGGVEDHVHILSSLHPKLTLSDFIKAIKVGSHTWIDEIGLIPRFSGWQDGYGAFTHSMKEKDGLVEYIKGQEEHHKRVSFKEELRKLLMEAGVPFDEKYLE